MVTRLSDGCEYECDKKCDCCCKCFHNPFVVFDPSKVDMRHAVFNPESSEITISLKSGRGVSMIECKGNKGVKVVQSQ